MIAPSPRPLPQPGRRRQPLQAKSAVRGLRATVWIRETLASRDQILPYPAPYRRISTYFWFATLLFFAGVYVDIPIRLSETAAFPMVSALPGLALLLFHPGVVTGRTVRFVLLPSLFVLVMGVLAPNPLYYAIVRLIGAGQTGFSALMGFVAAWVLARCGRNRLHKFLAIALPVFLVLIFVEVILPQAHTLMLGYLKIYGYDLDLDALANREDTLGGYRPKLFTSEPSYVATSAMLMVIGYVWTGNDFRRYLVALMFTVLAAIIIRSPIILLAIPPIVLAVYTDRALGRFRSVSSFWVTLGIFGALSLIVVVGAGVIASRFNAALSGDDYSTTYRTYGAIAVAIAVLQRYPLFGIGAGSIALVKNTIISTYLSFGVPLEATETEWHQSINNAYAAVPMYFGAVGTGIVLLALWRLFRSDVAKPRLPVVLAFLGYCITYGGIYTPKFVITMAVMLTVAKMRPAAMPERFANMARRRPGVRMLAGVARQARR